jgi:hypothetical protein
MNVAAATARAAVTAIEVALEGRLMPANIRRPPNGRCRVDYALSYARRCPVAAPVTSRAINRACLGSAYLGTAIIAKMRFWLTWLARWPQELRQAFFGEQDVRRLGHELRQKRPIGGGFSELSGVAQSPWPPTVGERLRASLWPGLTFDVATIRA